jgi:hypothetical protein
VASSTLQVGEWALGVRSTSADVDAGLRQILAAHVLDAEAPPNFSILMADASGADGHSRSFNFLYRASQKVMRTRAPGRIVRGLSQYLSEFAASAPGTLNLSATALIAGDRAIVGPYELLYYMEKIETRLNAAGIRVVDSSTVHLEPDTGAVVVPEPVVNVNTDALADFERRNPTKGREPAPVPPGRYPILAWAFVTDEDKAGRAIGRAESVADAAQLVTNGGEFGAQQTLEVVVAAVAQAPAHGIWWADPGSLLKQIRAVAGG